MSRLSQQLRRLAIMARCGQDFENFPASLQSEWKTWMSLVPCSPEPQTILARLADYCEQSERLRRQSRAALVYPRVVLVCLALLCLGLAVVDGPPLVEALGLKSGWLRAWSHQVWLGLGLIPVLMLVFSVYRGLSLSSWAGRWFGRSLLSEVDQILWCSSLSHFLELEVDLGTALEWVGAAIREPGTRLVALRLSERVRSGSSLWQALEEQPWDPLIAWAARAGQEHQTLAEALSQVSQCLEETLRDRIQRQLAWLQPVALLLCGLLVALVFGIFWSAYGSASLSLS